jgi:pyruvate formate lyase activating enzyme
MSVEDIMAEVMKDKAYYNNTGGGLTLSGGEPTLQTSFIIDLIKQAKKKCIHVVIDTCGYSKQETFASLLPFVDLFLFDYKATGEELHKTLTGVGQESILNNLEFLINQGANVILRCPIIPGINDQEEHLKAIALLSQKYPSLKAVEILPYHDYGRWKWKEIGKEYILQEIPSVDNQQLDQWKSSLLEYGCLHLT